MKFKYTFKVRNFRTSKDNEYSIIFDEKLNNDEVKEEIFSILFGNDNVKNVSLKCLEVIDELGNVIEKQKKLYY